MNKIKMSAPLNPPLNFGKGMEQKYEFYFPENACSYDVSDDMSTCRKINYPLMGGNFCKLPCLDKADKSIYGQVGPDGKVTTDPSQLYGDATRMGGGNGIYYYEQPFATSLPLSVLSLPGQVQPTHIPMKL